MKLTTENEPITGPGILWALGQINKRFERAAQFPPSEEKEAEEQTAATTEGD